MQEKNMGHICPIGRSGVKCFRSIYHLTSSGAKVQTIFQLLCLFGKHSFEINFVKICFITCRTHLKTF